MKTLSALVALAIFTVASFAQIAPAPGTSSAGQAQQAFRMSYKQITAGVQAAVELFD